MNTKVQKIKNTFKVYYSPKKSNPKFNIARLEFKLNCLIRDQSNKNRDKNMVKELLRKH